MEAYTNFAQVYDVFMDNVPYAEWAAYIEEILKSRGIRDGLVLDLCCGTGSLTECLAEAGYDMIGIDRSLEMLEIAQEKKLSSGRDILYLLQDMREFELYGTVRAVVSVCDSVNYILQEEELEKVFCLVNNYLDPGGIFFFDFNTTYKYEKILGEQVIAEDREECSFIWNNFYHEEKKKNVCDLTLFVREEEDLYRKFQETHVQRGYTLGEIRRLLQRSGLEFCQAFDAYTGTLPRSCSERITVVAKEQGKGEGESGR